MIDYGIMYKKIDGFFTWPRLYRDMVKKFPSGSTFVEVGVFEGKSLSFLVAEKMLHHKKITMYAVDPFYGLKGFDTIPRLVYRFKRNMYPVHTEFKLITKPSTEAALQFKDKSVDFVFIDANHDYEYVKEDILAWLPKIKEGGIIAGHDYHEIGDGFPGVYKAVQEIFGERIDKKYLHEFCWLVKL